MKNCLGTDEYAQQYITPSTPLLVHATDWTVLEYSMWFNFISHTYSKS